MTSLEALFTPADFAALAKRDLTSTCCVVFDVLRATSTMVTALWNGASAVLPVDEISEAIAARAKQPGALLAGERDGLRISAALTGGIEFDLGNSPREFTRPAVEGRTIVMSTTNGTRALRACRGARETLAASFLNLSATTEAIRRAGSPNLLLVCSGTLQQAAYEDVLGAGALCDLVWSYFSKDQIADSAQMARQLFLNSVDNLAGALSGSRNARRLLSHPDLKEDVAFCLQRDLMPLIASLATDGWVRRSA
jgi:2-phosphosulfolactate phosphatase